jgi:hypothetical protein
LENLGRKIKISEQAKMGFINGLWEKGVEKMDVKCNEIGTQKLAKNTVENSCKNIVTHFRNKSAVKYILNSA